MITIITGPRGVGKTTFLNKLINRKRKGYKKISGILTPPIYNKSGQKVGFNALDIETGDKWELGRNDKKLEGPTYGQFSFSSSGFYKANTILENTLNRENGILILDEIGPLELSKKDGFYPVLFLFGSIISNLDIFLVIRPELIDEFVNGFIPKKEYRLIEISQKNRNNFETLMP